eukprot:1224102-Pyramimonas_sp.AAC.1
MTPQVDAASVLPVHAPVHLRALRGHNECQTGAPFEPKQVPEGLEIGRSRPRVPWHGASDFVLQVKDGPGLRHAWGVVAA